MKSVICQRIFPAIVGALLFPCGLLAQDEAAKTEQMRSELTAAAKSNDSDAVESILKDNRLAIKPFVEELVAASILAELSGKNLEAVETAKVARELGRAFQEAFGEKSLATATEYLDGWSLEQKKLKLTADSLYASGTSLRGKRDTREQAQADYERARDLYTEIGDQIGVGSALGGLGYVSWFTNREKYHELNSAALAVRREVDDRQLVGNSLNDVGLAYRVILRDNETALLYYLESEEVRIEIGDSLALARLLPNIARTYTLAGDLESSLPYYNRAASVADNVGDLNRQAVALRNAGGVLSDLGRLNDALDYFTRALSVREEQGVPAADVLNHLGITHRRLGDFESALEYYQEVVEIATETEDKEELAAANSNIGVVYIYAGRPSRSIRYFERAKKQFEEIGDTDGVLDATINLASGHFEMQDYESAETLVTEALVLARQLEDELGESTTRILVGNVLSRLGRFDESIESFEAGLQQAIDLNVPDLIFSATLGLGEVNERSRNYDKAISYYEDAFLVLEGTRGNLDTDEDKAGFLAQQRYAYEEYIHMLTRLHREFPEQEFDDRAFLTAERAKARAFLDLLAEALADVQSGLDPSLLAKQDSLLQELAGLRNRISFEKAATERNDEAISELETRLEVAEAEYSTLERTLREENPRYAELQYPQPSSLSEIQAKVLDDEVVLLEYSVGDSSSTLWIVTNESRELAQLPDRDSIREQVELLRFALTDPNSGQADLFAKTSHNLYQMLVEPAAATMKERSKVVVVPDDVLYYLPFESLISDSVSNATDYSTLPYLIQSHSVSYAQSASILEQLSAGRASRNNAEMKGLLAFGDPVFASELESMGTDQASFLLGSDVASLARLPFSGEEVISISQYFTEGDADVFLRDAATEDQIKSDEIMGRYKYLHLATHGLVDERRPDFSSVVLAHDDDLREDGLLQAAEIFNLKVSADLVVLSACETGLGRMVAGEGLVGLTRAFMYAGAPSVVVSLWSVADASTASLMDSFYSNLVGESAGKTESLRLAKLEMIASSDLAHPFHWAPFVLTGDWH